MTPYEKISYVQRQCDAMVDSGKEIPVYCPYCFHTVQPGKPPCCQLLAKCVKAIIERYKKVSEGLKEYESRSIRRNIMEN